MTIEFRYDGLSRRVEKKTTIGTGTPDVEGYLYDDWNVVMISKLNTDGSYNLRKWSCIWRPDVASSLYGRTDWQKAGGVGGLAWMQTGIVQSYYAGYTSTGGAEIHIPFQDHMGNVRHYYRISIQPGGGYPSGTVSANFEYDAFGREVRAWGANTPTGTAGQPAPPPGLPAGKPWVDQLPFHFSTKFTDAESGLNYYGYRFYDPLNGRWLNRDPFGEDGGLNQQAGIMAQCLYASDYLGLAKLKRDYSVVKNDELEEEIKIIGTRGHSYTSVDLLMKGMDQEIGQYDSSGIDPCNCYEYLTIWAHGANEGQIGLEDAVIQSQASAAAMINNATNLPPASTARERQANQELIDQAERARKGQALLAKIKSYMCKGGKVRLKSCEAGTGEEGAKLQAELAKFFGADITLEPIPKGGCSHGRTRFGRYYESEGTLKRGSKTGRVKGLKNEKETPLPW